MFKELRIQINPSRIIGLRDEKIYGHFLEHFHRQVYGGVFDPNSSLSNGDGFRSDVIGALKDIKTSVIRWPGGCFASAYHWKDGVGKGRSAVFDKA
jgi:alpha-L-arabinofuranosidase